MLTEDSDLADLVLCTVPAEYSGSAGCSDPGRYTVPAEYILAAGLLNRTGCAASSGHSGYSGLAAGYSGCSASAAGYSDLCNALPEYSDLPFLAVLAAVYAALVSSAVQLRSVYRCILHRLPVFYHI